MYKLFYGHLNYFAKFQKFVYEFMGDRNGQINFLCVVGASAGSSEGAGETFEARRSSAYLCLGF